MKFGLYILLFFFLSFQLRAQSTAQNWIKDDCDGNTHNLFNELDSGYVIMLEFVMQCGSCIAAANDLNTIYNDYQVSHPGKVRYYMMDYSYSFSCDTMQAWAHGINCTKFLDGSHEVGYYGPFGMPTIVVLGGINHSVFYNGHGFNPTFDIQYIRDAIDLALATSNIPENETYSPVKISPNPAQDKTQVTFSLQSPSDVTLKIYDFNGGLLRMNSLGKFGEGENRVDIDFAFLKEGIYTLLIFSESGVLKSKLVIQK